MKTTSRRYIDATEEAIVKVARLFKVSDKYVYMCLTYRRNSELAKKIRYTVVSHYGGKPMHHCPECETIFIITEERRSLMRQLFDNGAVLEADRGTGEVVVTNRKGEVKGIWHRVDIPTLSKIQLFADSL